LEQTQIPTSQTPTQVALLLHKQTLQFGRLGYLEICSLFAIQSMANFQILDIFHHGTRTLPVAVTAPNSFSNFTINNGVVFLKPKNDNVTITITPYLIRTGGAGIVVAGNAELTLDINMSFTVFGLSEK
jgi:hypothetical protein